MTASFATRLEQYTLRYPQEVLLVEAEIDGEPDQIMVFKGVSSSLMRATAFDPDVPVLPETAAIASISRLAAPFNPANPQTIEAALSADEFAARLMTLGL